MSIRYDTISNNQKKPFNSVLIKRDRVRIDASPGATQAIMINLDSGEIVQVHAQSRRYFRINAQTINQYATFYQRNKTLLQGLLDHGLQQMNPHQRDQITQIIDNYNEGSESLKHLSVEPAGRSDRVLGAECSVIGIFNRGKLQREVCISSYQQLGLNNSDVRSLEQLKNFLHQFREAAPRQKQEIITLLTRVLGELNGVPLKIINYDPNGEIRNVIQAASISFRPIPDQAYHIPDGFQEQKTPVL